MYDNKILKELKDNTESLLYKKTIDIPTFSDKAAILIENRINYDIKYAVYNHMYFLDGKFKLYIFHSEENETFIKNELIGIDNIIYIKFDYDISNALKYTDFCLSPFIYQYVLEEHILTFQTDSLMLKKWNDIYNNYDLIGSPWEKIPYGGNGGITYRSRKLIMNALDNLNFLYNILGLYGNHDDVILSVFAHLSNLKVNYLSDGIEFGVETIFNENAMCCHQIVNYHSDEDISKIIKHLSYDN